MSDLAAPTRLRQAESQLPAAWYCEPGVLEAERRSLFARGPGYVGHELMVPKPGDYHALAARDNAQALVHGPTGIELLSNICRHRQAIMLNGSGHADNIVCPVHRWTYALDGRLLGAPQFETQPCASLARAPTRRWRGLVFDGPRDVTADLGTLSVPDLDFTGYALNRIEVHECHYNWKTFIEVYLEDYHV
ncbi:MAG: aromatic ring-hydroxylating oxygenase subunit alpha, partial [Casimicrobiaceae bacterium]